MAFTRDILWLGAHKTGTTYLQGILSQSRVALANARILYFGMHTFRSRVTKPLLYSRNTDGSLSENFRFGTHGQGRMLIFDENILALVQNAQATHALYPDGEERALKLATSLGLKHPTLVLGIRNYSTFLPSLYCETLKAQPFLTFREFHITRFEALSWHALVERLLAAFPESRLQIYSAETMQNREAELLSWVCANVPNSDWTVDVPSIARREGFSHDAVVALHELSSKRGGGNVSALDLTNCLRAHPRNAQNRAYNPWTPEEKTALDALYQEDLDSIRSLPRVDFWQPAS